MAIMHPSGIPEGSCPYSEEKFFSACKEQLPEKCHVFYSVRWYTTNHDGVREDSECDFLIVHPNYGFLCVEVKGGTGMRVEDGAWYLTDRYGERRLHRSPYAQAEASMRFFKKYYEDETEKQFTGTYGCAAAFPNYDLPAALHVSAPKEMTIDHADMDNLSKRITEIFQYFQTRRQIGSAFLSGHTRDLFLRLVNKRVALSISSGALLPDKARELDRINVVQDAVIDLLTHYPRAFIVGGAGTGKTWIGFKKILRCIQAGGRALYLCYNKALADYASTVLADARAACHTMDSLAVALLKQAALTAVEKDGCREYSALLEKLPSLPKYDLVVVDEGQDFTEDWAYCANLLCKDEGALYVLYDRAQNIFARSFGEKFFIDGEPFVLRYNIRNTANIYRYAQEQTALGLDTVANRVEGVAPEHRRFSRRAEAVHFIDATVHKLVNREGIAPDKIVILSNRRKEHSILAETATVGGHAIRDTRGGAASEGIAYRTIQGFKGLESDIVIYIHHTYRNEPQTERLRATLYTAQTRARFYLYRLDFEDPRRV